MERLHTSLPAAPCVESPTFMNFPPPLATSTATQPLVASPTPARLSTVPLDADAAEDAASWSELQLAEIPLNAFKAHEPRPPDALVSIQGSPRIDQPPGITGFMPKNVGRRQHGRPSRAYQALLTEQQHRDERYINADPFLRSAQAKHAQVLSAVGDAYVAARSLLLKQEQTLVLGQQAVVFVFGPTGRNPSASHRPEHSSGRELWLQWIAGPKGSGWAFFQPTVKHSFGLAPKFMPSAQQPAEAITTERASLDDFLKQVEVRYVGFEDLSSIQLDGKELLHNGIDAWSHDTYTTYNHI